MMSKIFIGGSRKVSRLGSEVRSRVDRIMEKNLPVVVGDANGADKAVQHYLLSKKYHPVEVFCAGGECRNNLGRWPVRHITADGCRRDFDFYSVKDRAMANEATFGFMIWDGKSAGTLMNVFRLITQQKKVALYVTSSKMFIDIKSQRDWEQFISKCAAEVRRRIQDQAEAEERHIGVPAQPELV